jgi:hypothetical protein
VKAATAELALEDDEAVKFTTQQVNQLLFNKYTEKGEHVLLFDVPNVVGLNQSRRCDAVAIGMWQSSGRLIQGFEVKVSRSDWLREVRDVAKADPFIEQCDRWWLVTGHQGVAKTEEVPDAWGWMTATKTGLRIQRPPKPLPQDKDTMRRLWAFALIRTATDRSGDSKTMEAAINKRYAELQRQSAEQVQREIARINPAFERLSKQVDDFEKASGMKLEDWRLGNVGKLARRLNQLSEDGYGGFTRTLQSQLSSLKKLSENIESALQAVGAPALDDEEGSAP